ncbi:sugar ABC transporter permease [Kineococcus sp. NPDC059986]|jgi:multiple sugar transport system permease protein|uniref:carbohydrate ABC transporter permease n=1 Tax=Kineococcus sp. NPDC059986 TaxID=3155538 RepID=UPI00344D3FC8
MANAHATAVRVAHRASGERRPRRSLLPYALITPTAVLLLVLMILPLVIVVANSLSSQVVTRPGGEFAGLTNFSQVLTDPTFWPATLNTVVFAGASVAVHLVMGLCFALLLNSPLIGRTTAGIFRTVLILPWLFTAAVIAVLWRLILAPTGVVNYGLESIGLIHDTVQWFGDPSTALFAVTVMNIWAGYPFFMLSLLAGLQGVPAELHEAATVDGAGPWQRFWSVTLPQLRPIIVSMAILDLLWTTQQFALIWLTTGGGPLGVTEMLSTFTYKLAFGDYDLVEASASAVLVLLFSLVVAVFYVRHQRRADA